MSKKGKKQKDTAYLKGFDTLVEYAVEESKMVLEVLQKAEGDRSLENKLEYLSGLERTSSQVAWDIYAQAQESFLTPINREDIVDIARQLHGVVSDTGGIAKAIYAYNIGTATPESIDMAKMVEECCMRLRDVIESFKAFKKPKELISLARELDECETRADKVYMECVRSLYGTEGVSVVDVLAWGSVYDAMESCCDSCSEVALSLARAILKNS